MASAAIITTLLFGRTSGNTIPVAGINWASIVGPPDNNYSAVCFDPTRGRFTAVSTTGTNRIFTSDDFGATWTPRTAAEAVQFRGITYAEDLDRLCAVAISGTARVQTSDDGGVTWVARTAAAANQWASVRRANGRFVSTGISGTGRIQWSNDGITWTLATGQSDALTWWDCDFHNGKWIAVAAGSTSNINKLASSSDNGATWTMFLPTTQQFLGIRYDRYRALWILIAGDGTNRLKWSVDGTAFTNGTGVNDGVQWEKGDFSNHMFIAIGSTAGTTRIASTVDGKAWTSVTTPALNSYLSVAYGRKGVNVAFVAVGQTGTGNRIMRSIN